MEAGDFVWLIAIAFWLFSGLISRFGGALRKAQRRTETRKQTQEPLREPERRQPVDARESHQGPSAPPPVPPDPARRELEKAFRELVASVGLGGGEHSQDPKELRQQDAERRVVVGEHTVTRSEHERSVGELTSTGSELIPSASEHRRTPSEHTPGDVAVRMPIRSGPAKVHARPRSARTLHVRRLLTNRDSLADAILLREILGSPPGLEPPK